MNNQNNNVIKPSFSNENHETLEQDNNSLGTVKAKKKFNPLLIILVLIVVIALVVGSKSLFNGNGGPKKTNDKKSEEEKITIDSEYEWANKYGEYIQDYFATLNKFDIAFVEFTNDDIPELIVSYEDKAQETSMEILTIKNNDVIKTRTFSQAKLYLITPVNLEQVSWYLYIGDNDYGKYTIVSDLIAGTALDATIKATNAEEVNKYKTDYVNSDFALTFYEVEKSTFKDDYLTKVGRYTEDTEKVNEAISKLKEERSKYISDNNIDITTQTVIKLNNYTLELGIYIGTIYTSTDGKIQSTTDTLVINSLNGLIYKSNELSFTTTGNTINCSDGTVFTVTGNNELQYMDKENGPVTYKIPEPEKDKKDSNETN